MYRLTIRLGSLAIIAGVTLSSAPITARADAVVATANVVAGTLAFTSVPAVLFGNVTLSGSAQFATATQSVQVLDARGTGAGWSFSLSGGPLTLNSQALPPATVGVPSGGCVGLPATCTSPLNSVANSSYPITISTTAQKIFGASAGSGLGAVSVALPYSQDVPPTASTGAYTATWTLTLGTSP